MLQETNVNHFCNRRDQLDLTTRKQLGLNTAGETPGCQFGQYLTQIF